MATSERSLANLRPPWKPGESGNANGRKKGLVTLLREVLEQTELQGCEDSGRTLGRRASGRIDHRSCDEGQCRLHGPSARSSRREGRLGCDVRIPRPDLGRVRVGDDGRNPDQVIIELPKKDVNPRTEAKPTMARPRKPVDGDQVRRLAGLGHTLRDIGRYFDVDEKTIRNRFSEEYRGGMPT